jgi:hypothetical protein
VVCSCVNAVLVIVLSLALSACAVAQGPYPAPGVIHTTWGVYPYEMRPNGLLINGLTPVDPMEHF